MFLLIIQCLQHRALNPDDPLPELSPVIANGLKPPVAIETKCEPVIKEMKNLFKLKPIERKKDEKTGDDMFKDEYVNFKKNLKGYPCEVPP